MSTQARRRLRRLRVHRPADLRVPARVQRPVRRRRARTRPASPRRWTSVPGIEHRPSTRSSRSSTRSAPLTELFTGAKVVCNTVGPFAKHGREVVEACLAAGCHYLDTTGEQDWLIACDETYGAAIADAGLLLAPGVAQMYTTGEIAANICLETPGLDTLDILVLLEGLPDRSPRRRRSSSTRPWPRRTTSSRTSTWSGPPTPALYDVVRARPARDRARAAVGRHLAPGVVQARPAGGQRQGARRRVQPRRSCRACRRSWPRRWSRSRTCPTTRSTPRSPSRPPP